MGTRVSTAAVVRRVRVTERALGQLAGGAGTGLLALVLTVSLVAVALTSLVGIGLVLVRPTLQAVRALADRERRRLGRWGAQPVSPGPVPPRLHGLRDRDVRGELVWTVSHAVAGTVLGVVAVFALFAAFRDLTFLLWWWLLPDGYASASVGLWVVHDWPGALAVVALGAGWAALLLGAAPPVAVLAGRIERWLLSPRDLDPSLRIAHLTATRAAALDAHAAELRRIERSLHDGAQNRMVAAAILVGAARRSLATRGPEAADRILGDAQDVLEQALAELRGVVRDILPPVLADRGLAAAVDGLAETCAVPCTTELVVDPRLPVAVEVTAYAVVAEALTNLSRHSGASAAQVVVARRGDVLEVTVTDDGRGGAREGAGSGLAGIRRRVEAFDGRWTLQSPPGGPTRLEVELPCAS